MLRCISEPLKPLEDDLKYTTSPKIKNALSSEKVISTLADDILLKQQIVSIYTQRNE